MRTAAYARYSSDKQQETSIEDQLRNVVAHCDRQSWPAPQIFSDYELTGARADRPQYRAMLAAATRREFDVLLVDDMYRLSRDQVELPRAVRALKFAGVRVIGVSDGFDSDRESYKLEMGMRGIMGEAYLDAIAKNTHRGLMGRALKGSCAGGRAFGYRVAAAGQRAIDDAEAAIVREIYQLFAGGRSARAIAAELNQRGLRPARGRTWSMSAIYGDVRRGIGILANPIYVGRMIWNRSHWPKDPTTGRRRRVETPESEWVITEHPELRIVSDELWAATRAKLKECRARSAEIRARNSHAVAPGRRQRHLLSGLLRCGGCGGAMVMVNHERYACSVNKNRGPAVCAWRATFAKSVLEPRILAALKAELLSEEAFRLFEADARRLLKESVPDLAAAKRRVDEAERRRDNIMAAIAAGILTPTTKAGLLQAEGDVAAAAAELDRLVAFQPAQMLPRAREVHRRLVEQLEAIEDVAQAREALRELVGEIRLVGDGRQAYAEIGASGAESSLTVVAGARSVRYLSRPIKVPVTGARILAAEDPSDKAAEAA